MVSSHLSRIQMSRRHRADADPSQATKPCHWLVVATAAGRPPAAATAGVLEATTGAAEAEAMPAGARACLEASQAQTPACAWTRAPGQGILGESVWRSHSEASARIAP